MTVKIYARTQATGTPVQTLTVNSASGAWTVDCTTALAAGTYTAQAEQSDNAGNTGVSAPHMFTVTASPPEISIGDKTVAEGNGGTVPAAFAVTLNHAAAGAGERRLGGGGGHRDAAPPTSRSAAAP